MKGLRRQKIYFLGVLKYEIRSLLATPDGERIVPRTHDFGARLWVRIFGLIYAHPSPCLALTTPPSRTVGGA